MSPFEIFFLSAVEGLTEFLPISSTGHLILISRLFHVEQTDFVKSFEIAIQLGAILAVVAAYARRVWGNGELVKKIIVAFLPAGVIGFFLYHFIKDTLIGNEYITVAALFFGGVFLIAFEKFFARKNYEPRPLESLTHLQAFFIGVCQSLAVVPGVSRSAASVLGGMMAGLGRVAALEFSFLLAVPTMFAAAGFDLWESGSSFQKEEWGMLLFGVLLSAAVASVAIRWLLRFVEKHTFLPFGVYRIVLAFAYWFIILR